MTNMDGKEHNKPKGARLACFDLIRVFACVCVVMTHFNAKISDNFLYNNHIVPNFYFEGRVGLGAIGVSLFFMLSGATQMLTYREGNLIEYYKKRFLNLFPLFWMAYLIATIVDFLCYKWVNLSNPSLFFYTLAGVDGYLCGRGFIGFEYYKLGEWFLGCILLIYAVFPVLYIGIKKRPVLTAAIALAIFTFFEIKANIGSYTVTEMSFYLRIPEILFGMFLVKHKLWEGKKPIGLFFSSICLFALMWFVRGKISGLTMTITFCLILFSGLVLLSRVIKNEKWKHSLSTIGGITYAVFLVHHWLIAKIVAGFDLKTLSKGQTVMMFISYLAITLFLAWLLKRYGGKITEIILDLIPARGIKVLALIIFLGVVILPVNAAVNHVRRASVEIENAEAQEEMSTNMAIPDDMKLSIVSYDGPAKYMSLDIFANELAGQGSVSIASNKETCYVEGWAADPLAGGVASSVFIQVGNEYYATEYGKARPEVAEVYGSKAYLNSGYIVVLNADEVRKAGSVVVHVISADRTYRYAPITYTVNSGS